MRRLPWSWSGAARRGALGFAVVSALSAFARPARVEADEVLYRSGDLRIVRRVDTLGKPTVLLTNLDDEGSRLSGETEEQACPPSPSAPEGPTPAGPTEPAPRTEVRVIVNVPGGGSSVQTAVPVEPQTDGAGGTTVVVNVGGPGSDREESTTPPQFIYAPLPLFALAGSFVYPPRQAFLGYGTGGVFPSFFSGLGLNVGNRFGLKTGRSCGSGYDCFFRP